MNINKEVMKPFFSIVIPTRNRHDTLHYSIETVLQQNFDDYEIFGNDNRIKSIKRKIFNFVNKDNFLNHKNKKNGNFYINFPKYIGHTYNNSTKMYRNDFFAFFYKNAHKVSNTITLRGVDPTPFFVSFKTENEANHCLTFLKSKIARFALSFYKITMSLDRGELKAVPWLDWTQEWDDKKLQKYFGLTDEEMKFIDEKIGDYYEKDLKKYKIYESRRIQKSRKTKPRENH